MKCKESAKCKVRLSDNQVENFNERTILQVLSLEVRVRESRLIRAVKQ